MSNNIGKVLSINISEHKGTVKHAVDQIVCKEDYGIIGDAHAESGSIRQISLLAKESIDKMIALGLKGLCFGKFAENITTSGIVLYELPVGTVLKIGETLQQVTQIGKKCHASDGCEVARTVGTCIMPKEGIFTRVIEGGVVKAGDTIEIYTEPFKEL